jgi:hypothetical protein
VLNLRNRILSLVPLVVLATIFWKPALFDGKSIIHGDSIADGLSLLTLQFKSFHHLGQLLWSDGIYGGHPLFAEGQGAFASPFNMILAWVVAPLFGPIFTMNLAHWLSMILTGLGVVGLCRSLGASRASSCFASIAVVFSMIWIGAAQNMTISGALTWVPWAFWALEVWLKRPEVKSAVLLGGAVAMTILSGYPQAFHGAVIYMTLTLIVIPFNAAIRRVWITGWRVRLSTGVLAILVCAGLSAVQWLPLLELTSLSHRSGGIANAFRIPLIAYSRGFLFTWPRIGGSADYFPGTGSLLISVLASLVLIVRMPNRVKGHLLAAFILLQLGAEEASPLFQLLNHNNLVPGLRYFRTFHIYINIAIIGFSALTAFTIDGFSRISVHRTEFLHAMTRSDIVRIVVGTIIAASWVWATLSLRMPDIGWVNYGAVAAATLGGGALIICRRGYCVPIFMVVLLIGECMNLRLHEFHFYDPALLTEPASAAAIAATPSHRDDKLFDNSLAGSYGFTDSRDPAEANQARRLMESIAAMTNTLWGLRSINGALALPTHRQTEAEKQMRDEIGGQTANPPGARLIDLLAVRFITVELPLQTPAFRLFWNDPTLNAQIMENTAARSRFQLYTHHLTVSSPDEALGAIKALKTPTLVIENPPDTQQAEPLDANDGPAAGEPPASFDILKAKSTEYRVDVTTPHPVWFFIADANYPGWKATLDGKPTPLFSAQLLGKAVAVPEGKHRLEITFESTTFRFGLLISVTSIVAVLLLSVRRKREPMSPDHANPAL